MKLFAVVFAVIIVATADINAVAAAASDGASDSVTPSHSKASQGQEGRANSTTTVKFNGPIHGGIVEAEVSWHHHQWEIVSLGGRSGGDDFFAAPSAPSWHPTASISIDEWNAHILVRQQREVLDRGVDEDGTPYEDGTLRTVLHLPSTDTTTHLVRLLESDQRKGSAEEKKKVLLTSAVLFSSTNSTEGPATVATGLRPLPGDRSGAGHQCLRVLAARRVQTENVEKVELEVRPLQPREFLSRAWLRLHSVGVQAELDNAILEVEEPQAAVSSPHHRRGFEVQGFFSDVTHFIGDVKDLVKKAKAAIQTVERVAHMLAGKFAKSWKATIFNFDTKRSKTVKISDSIYKAKVSAKLTAKASVHASLRLYSNVSIEDYEVKSFSSILHGNAGVSVEADLEGQAKGSDRFSVGKWTLGAVEIPVGPMIFVLTPKISLGGGAVVQSEAAIKATASISGAMQVGFLYTAGAGSKPYTAHSFNHEGELLPTHIKLLKAAVYAEAILTAVIDGIGGPALALRAGPVIEVDPVADFCADAHLSLSVNGAIAAVVLGKSRWHHVLFTYSKPLKTLNIPDDSGDCEREKIETGQCHCIGLDQEMGWKRGSDGAPNRSNVPAIGDDWFIDYKWTSRKSAWAPEGSFYPSLGYHRCTRADRKECYRPLPYFGCYGESSGWRGYNTDQAPCWTEGWGDFCIWCDIWDGERTYTNPAGEKTVIYNGTLRCRMPRPATVYANRAWFSGRPKWWTETPWTECSIVPRSKSATEPKLEYVPPWSKYSTAGSTANRGMQQQSNDGGNTTNAPTMNDSSSSAGSSSSTFNRLNSSLSTGTFLGATVVNRTAHPICPTVSYIATLEVSFTPSPIRSYAAAFTLQTTSRSGELATVLCAYSVSASVFEASNNTQWNGEQANWTYYSNNTYCPGRLKVTKMSRLQLSINVLGGLHPWLCPGVLVTAALQLPCNGSESSSSSSSFNCDFVSGVSMPLAINSGVPSKNGFSELYAFATVPEGTEMPPVLPPYEEPFPPVNSIEPTTGSGSFPTGPSNAGDSTPNGRSDESTGLGGGAVAAIVICVVLLVVFIAAAVGKVVVGSKGSSASNYDAHGQWKGKGEDPSDGAFEMEKPMVSEGKLHEEA